MTLHSNIIEVRKEIETACLGCKRPLSSVNLIAVSKTVPAARIQEAVDAGIDNLGENYIQEARKKVPRIAGDSLKWHFIGHLQTNKVKYAVELFDLIHTVDSIKLAREINRQAAKRDIIQSILIQVNVAGEESKWGISPEETETLVQAVARLDHVRVHGLMTMPPFFHQPQKVRPFFKALADLAHEIDRLKIPNVNMNELSMGMSGDFEVAIKEGATQVRVGTSIFGERS